MVIKFDKILLMLNTSPPARSKEASRRFLIAQTPLLSEAVLSKMSREAHAIEAAERRQIVAPADRPGFFGRYDDEPRRHLRFFVNGRFTTRCINFHSRPDLAPTLNRIHALQGILCRVRRHKLCDLSSTET